MECKKGKDDNHNNKMLYNNKVDYKVHFINVGNNNNNRINQIRKFL